MKVLPLNTVIQGDVREVLKTFPDESVHCVITSPPYWGLRDYGVDGQIGLEPTPELYVENLVEICREIKRVLRKDGTFWLNMGDSYNSKPASGHSFRRDKKRVMPAKFNPAPGLKPKDLCETPSDVARALRADGWWLRSRLPWLKRNSMPGSERDRPSGSGSTVEYIFLLTKSAKYFYDNEAVKMPASAKTHSRGNGINPKSRKAPTGWDSGPGDHRQLKGRYPKSKQNASFSGAVNKVVAMRNRRPSDWFFESWQGLYEEDGGPLAFVVNPQSFKEAHFATFPEGLVLPMILAGTSEKGACDKCGTPWQRIIEKGEKIVCDSRKSPRIKSREIRSGSYETIDGIRQTASDMIINKKTIGWKPTCECYDEFYRIEFPKARSARKRHQRDAWDGRWRRVRRRPGKGHWPFIPCVVVDPFSGSGTVALVSLKLGRNYIGIDLKQEYIEMSKERVKKYLEQTRLI